MVQKNTTTTRKTGVEKIIDHLIANKDDIGAIIVSVIAKPARQIAATDGDKCDGLRMSADLVTSRTDKEKEAMSSIRFL